MKSTSVPQEFRRDLEKAIAVLRDHGAREVYVFGSVIEPFGDTPPYDIDIAVSGLPPRSFLHAYGIELDRLKERIYEELEQLEAELTGVRPLFEKLARRDPDEIELRAAALTLHGFYNGVEAVFLFIAKHFDNHVQGGIRWHRQLWDQMHTATER